MSIVRRPASALVTASLVVATLLSVAPSPAAALEPPRPLPHYRPDFVTETDTRPWIDCLWASGAMLLDKWTNGRVQVTHQRLRALSGDRTKGSNLDDLKVAYKRLGFNLEFSPDGGNRITFAGLLRRLKHGAGAVVLGSDHKLPRWYGRWDYGFWHVTKKEKKAAKEHPKKKALKDYHAVYIERYDPRHGRVWLMDPLGRGKWRGEWISISALHRFAWFSGGAIYAAVTPTAKAAPFARVHVGGVSLTRGVSTLDAAWALSAPRKWQFPGVDFRTSFTHPADPLVAAAVSAGTVHEPAAGASPERPGVSVAGHALVAKAALPAKPGAYLASMRLTDRRFGRTVAQTSNVAVFVPGPRRASLQLRPGGGDRALQARGKAPVSVLVVNTGTVAWADSAATVDDGLAGNGEPPRHTRLVARWVPLAVKGDAAAPDPQVLDEVPLDVGKWMVVDARLTAPAALGTWALVVDVEDDVDGSFAAHGSAPDVAVFEVLPATAFGPTD